MLLFQVAYILFYRFFSPDFVWLLLQYVTLFQSRELAKY